MKKPWISRGTFIYFILISFLMLLIKNKDILFCTCSIIFVLTVIIDILEENFKK